MRMFGLILSLIFLVKTVLTADVWSQDVETPAFLRSLESYNHMKFERCVNLDIDIPKTIRRDDGQEFVETTIKEVVPYVSYRMCTDCSLKTCGDSSFVAPLGTVIGNLIVFTQSHCTKCATNCKTEEVMYNMTSEECDACMEQCAPVLSSSSNNVTMDETKAVFCSAAYTNERGKQFYTKATCDGKGHVVIGLYSDNTCSTEVTKSSYTQKFSYDTFHAMETFCLDCAENECYLEEYMSLECAKGKNKNTHMIDDYNVCKAYHQATKNWRSSLSETEGLSRVFVIFLASLLGVALLYFIYKHIVLYLEELETERVVTGSGDDYLI